MANVLIDEKKQQVIALGRLGWTLRRIQEATGVRRETASAYLKSAGIAVRQPGGWGRRAFPKPANEVITDFGAGKPTSGHSSEPVPQPTIPSPASEPSGSKPATGVITDSGSLQAPEEADRRDPTAATSGPIISPSAELAPAAPVPPTRSPSASACEPYRELIELGLARGRNAMAIWQDLVSEANFTNGYQSVRRFLGKLRGTAVTQAHPVIVTAPGEEAQVDYGTGPMVRDPQSGKYRRTRLFVMTLGYSRKSVRLLVFQSSTRTWAELHEKAFRRLGGVVRLMVLDNLREGVLAPDVYDPTLNPLYRDVLAHYGVVAMPCRVQHPDRKDQASYCTSLGILDAS